MPARPKSLLRLPSGFPKITTGVLLSDGHTLVTGHTNGYVARWREGGSRPDILLRASSAVNAIIESRDGGVIVGCNAGDLYILTGKVLTEAEQVLPPTNTKHTRVFRIAQPLPSTLLYTSTYGVITLLKREPNGWSTTQLLGHAHAVFAIAHRDDKLLATGDYRGNIRVWEAKGTEFELRHRLVIDSYVSGLTFLGPQLLAAIGQSGRIFLFEHQGEGETDTWRTIFETDTASGAGASVQPDAGSRVILAVTAREIIQVDPVSQEIKSAQVNGGLVVFPGQRDLRILNDDGLVQISITDLAPKVDLVQYEYLKVSLLGNTSYGKTTLCSSITTGDPGSHLSTFGRRIWTWTVKAMAPQRRILLNDNGGQEQVIGTLLPLSADSDAILYFFKQTELGGFRTALQLHRQMKPLIASGAKSFLVETYTDHPLAAVTDDHIAAQIKTEGFEGLFKVSPTRIDEVETFKKEFPEKLDWSTARRAVQSASAAGLEKTIEELKRQGKTVSNVSDIRTAFETTTGSSIYVYHLKFLLHNLADSGQLEYYPKIGDVVILDDPEFNKLRTEIPIYAGEQHGIVRWSEVAKKYPGRSTYVAMLDLFYTANGISIPFGDKGYGRVFPTFLEDRVLNVPADFSPYVINSDTLTTLFFPVFDPELATLLTAVCDMQLTCIDATKNEALFAWGLNACIYYHLVPSQSLLEGPRLKVSFKVGGRDQEAVDSLRAQFQKLLHALYGNPHIVDEARES